MNSSNGQIQIQDFDDLKLMTSDTLHPIIRVTDEQGLFYDEQITVNLADWTYLAGRLQIEDASLTAPINVSIGTSIHVFSSEDSDGGTIEYILVSGEGDGNNSLFTLDINGNLKTAVSFEQALKNSYLTLRVQAKDSRYNTAEKSFSVKVVNLSDNDLGHLVLSCLTDKELTVFLVGGTVNGLVLFTRNYYPWVYHKPMGWIYVSSDELLGTWLYRKNLGWVWTMKDVYPALYMDNRKGWTFLDVNRNSTTLYDYSELTWFELDTPLEVSC